MKITLDISQSVIDEIKEEIKEQGYVVPGDKELSEILALDIEANFEIEVDDEETLSGKAEWIINQLELDEEK
jgi:aspartate/methionine/tyrosine aminotransferase